MLGSTQGEGNWRTEGFHWFSNSTDTKSCRVYCLHQGPTRKRCKQPGSLESPDIYIFENVDHCYGAPVVLGDMKLYDKLATCETGLYCSTSCLAQSGVARWTPIYIGLPCWRKNLALYVYIENKYSDKHDADGHSHVGNSSSQRFYRLQGAFVCPVLWGSLHSRKKIVF